MKRIVHDIEQGTDDWLALRAGKLTSSKAGDMVAEVRTGEAAARRNLRVKLALERITGAADDEGFVSRPMQRGHELEPFALTMYEAASGNFVTSCGFVELEGVAAGASPDGLVGDDGLVEAKCPLAATHLGYLKNRNVPKGYAAQCAHLLWVTGREWCDWVSYHPDFPRELRLLRIRIPRNVVGEYEAKAREFLGEVNVEVERILELARERSAFPPDGDNDQVAGGAATRKDAELMPSGEAPTNAPGDPNIPDDPKEAVEYLCERDNVTIDDAKAWAKKRLHLQRFTRGCWPVILEEWDVVLIEAGVPA